MTGPRRCRRGLTTPPPKLGELMQAPLRLEWGCWPFHETAYSVAPQRVHVHGAGPRGLIVDQGVARAHVVIAAAHERPRPPTHRPAVRARQRPLETRHAGQPVARHDAGDRAAGPAYQGRPELGVGEAPS